MERVGIGALERKGRKTLKERRQNRRHLEGMAKTM
jgi:hypothetical protein